MRYDDRYTSDIAFPQIHETGSDDQTKSHLQFRIYGHEYNEESYLIGNGINLFNSEKDLLDNYDVDDTLLYIHGVITGTRVMNFSTMPKANQKGVLNHFGRPALSLADWMVFLFWVEPIIDASYSSFDPMDTEDITEW